MNPEYRPSLHRYAVLLAICTLFLVVAGASVTKEAGLSVPDWPYQTAAVAVGLMTIVLAAWIQRVDSRLWMKRLAWAAFSGMILQSLLSGFETGWVSVAQACLAQLFFATTACIALFTSRRWLDGAPTVEDYGKPSLRGLAMVAPLVVFLQVALGAAFRRDVITVISHIGWSMITALFLLTVGVFVLSQFPKHDALRKAAHAMLGMTTLQVFLGLGAYWSHLDVANNPVQMVLVTAAHVTGGALTLAFTILLSIQIRRYVRLRATEISQSHAAVTP